MHIQIIHLDHEFDESETAASGLGDLWSKGCTAGDQRATVAGGNALTDLPCRRTDIRAGEVVGEDRVHIPSRFIRNIEVIVDVRKSSRERVLFVGQPVDAVEVAVIPERAWWWRGRCRSRRPFASSSGPDEEVAEQTEGFDKTKKFVVGQVIDVTSPSCAACDPTTVEDWIGFVKGRRELASKRIRNEESDEEVRRRDHRVWNIGADEGIGSLVSNHATSRREQDRIRRITIAVWIAPDSHRVRESVQARIKKRRRSPGDLNRLNRLAAGTTANSLSG